MPVDTKDKGTMVEESGTKPPETEAKTPASEKVSAQEKESTLTQSQHEAIVHAIKSEAGRQVKEAETARETLSNQIKSLETKVQDIESERDSLQQQIEDLSSSDPKRYDLIKKDKELRDRERDLKGKISTLDDRESKLTEREKKLSSFETEVLIETIADEYEDGDTAKLKKAVSVFDNPTEEQIRNISDIIFSKKAEEPQGEEQKKKHIDSGRTRGGSTYFTRTQIADRAFWEANKEAILEAEKEGRIRNE